MKVRRVRSDEEKIFVETQRKAIYPELSFEKMRQWGERKNCYAPLVFVLDEGGEIIGGATWEIQDHLDEIEVILRLDAFFIKEEWRSQGFGRRLLNESLKAARTFYAKQGLKVVGFVIQTTDVDKGAVVFYQKTLDFPFSMVSQRMGNANVMIFLFACDQKEG